MEKEELQAKLQKILACPICKANLKYSRLKEKLTCSVCKASYNIKKGMPVMLVKKK